MTKMQVPNVHPVKPGKSLIAYSRGRPLCRLVDMPELRDAIEAGDARVMLLAPLSRRGLPSDWALPIREDETVVATANVLVEEFDSVGIAALIVKTRAVPVVRPDATMRDEIASALADALIAGVT